jgi:hypothetical protein
MYDIAGILAVGSLEADADENTVLEVSSRLGC